MMLGPILFSFVLFTSAAAKVILCEGDDVPCVRETLAGLLNYQPISGEGTDSTYYTVPITVVTPLTNNSCVIDEVQFTGFKTAEIIELFQEDGFTVLTVNFANLGLNLFDYTCLILSHDAAPVVIKSFGDFAFGNATATIAFPGTENLDVTQTLTFVYQEGSQTFGLQDYGVQSEQPGFELAAQALVAANAQPNVLERELLKPVAIRYAMSYAMTNLVFDPNSPFVTI